ncbi:myogenesis-regulating glycosidase-like [Tubulanus polymorphus]|uniref:myogenesis-regulating glycosidase-like n=1 Tax=Tubulanus polymorphus TaxID=672921 RepID=UPI003DA43831
MVVEFEVVNNELTIRRGERQILKIESLGGSFTRSKTEDRGNANTHRYVSDDATLQITEDHVRGGDPCRIQIRREATRPNLPLEDAIVLDDAFWFGGAEIYEQRWPINEQMHGMSAYITKDPFNFVPGHGSVQERYWVSTSGFAVVVDPGVPLYVSLNQNRDGRLRLRADNKERYEHVSEPLHLSYTILIGNSIKSVHQFAQKRFLGWPKSIPHTSMIRRPIWSTWARFKADIDQEKVLQFSLEILEHNFLFSQLEIDDKYSSEYGEFDFDAAKFPDASGMVEKLHENGFLVTVWVHPFANCDSAAYDDGRRHRFWVQNEMGDNPGHVAWWQGENAAILDVTNPAAFDWFVSRLTAFQKQYKIDSFKFDAGEANFLPILPKFSSTDEIKDDISNYTTLFVDMASIFGNLVEVRSGYRTQRHGLFVRIMDLDSKWGYDNGLRSLIPKALLFGLLGYPFVLPDMIGGNAYNGSDVGKIPDRELFVRWAQVTAYFPAMQFSIAPWQYDHQVVAVCKHLVEIHDQIVYPAIVRAAQTTAVDGSPILRPLWWIDPTDSVCHTIDSQFVVGDEILVAPILDKDATMRDIYVPSGSWTDDTTSDVHVGPKWLKHYPVPLEKIPTFTKNV